MNHKRKRPKNRRAGCLMCKPYKVNGTGKKYRFNGGDLRRFLASQADFKEYFKG